MQILKRLSPAAVLALLSACAVPPPAAAPAVAPAVQPQPAPVSLVREQADPPQPLLEHPGKPPATGHVWIPGRWDLVEGRYRWQPGNWAAPRPGFVWLPHVWRRVGERWVQEGGRWEPDRNSPVRLRRG
jgi:WXXGXW repeat (2 copies)